MQGQYTRTYETSAGGTYPRFFIESVQDMLASEAAGRPIFKDEERVQILMPANRLLSPVHRVTDEHRNRWPNEYRAFREGIEIAPDGTPLEQWNILSKAQVYEFKGIHIRTIEDVAGMADSAMQQIPFGSRFREAARAYLDDSEASALQTKLTAENDRMTADIVGLRRENLAMREQMDKMWAELQNLRSAPNPLQTQIVADPYEQARLGRPVESGPSAFENFNAPKRRGRPPSVRSETEAAA